MISGVLFDAKVGGPKNLTNPQVSTLSVIVAFAVGFMLMFKLLPVQPALARGAARHNENAAFLWDISRMDRFRCR